MNGIPPIEPGLAWIAGGLLACLAEVVMPGAFLLWLGLAAIVAGLVTLGLGLSFGFQVLVFAVAAPVSVLIAQRRARGPKRLDVNAPANFLVGRSATALAFVAGEGRVRLGDSDWAARLASDAQAPPPGAALRVEAVDGTVLVVRPLGQ